MGANAQIIASQCKKRGFTGTWFSFKDTRGVKEFVNELLNDNSIILIKCDMYNYK